MDFDVGIIGGGPGGYVAAIKAAQAGLTCALFEENTIGGVCLNRGCIPTKTFLKSAQVYNTIKEAGSFGIDVENFRPNYPNIFKRKETVVKQLSGGVAGLLRKNNVTVINSRAVIQGADKIRAGDTNYDVKNIIIATGSRPAFPPIPGIESAMNSDGILNLTELPESVVIIGGGVIGVEFAFYLSAFGVKVTIVEALKTILANADRSVISAAEKILKRSGVAIYADSRVVSVHKNDLEFVSPDGSRETIEAGVVFCAAGRVPNSDVELLDKLGIMHSKGAIQTDEYMRTSVKDIFAIGDVNGKSMLAHTASAEGTVAIKNILGEKAMMNYRVIPQCVYTTPEIAWLGLTEKEALERATKTGAKIKTGVFPMAGNGKSLVDGDVSGSIKIIADEDNYLIGAHLVCEHASDMIAELGLMMNAGLLVQEIVETVHPHPTFSEAIMEAAEAVIGKPVHI